MDTPVFITLPVIAFLDSYYNVESISFLSFQFLKKLTYQTFNS